MTVTSLREVLPEILRTRGSIEIAGLPGSGKTTLIDQIQCHLHAGAPADSSLRPTRWPQMLKQARRDACGHAAFHWPTLSSRGATLHELARDSIQAARRVDQDLGDFVVRRTRGSRFSRVLYGRASRFPYGADAGAFTGIMPFFVGECLSGTNLEDTIPKLRAVEPAIAETVIFLRSDLESSIRRIMRRMKPAPHIDALPTPSLRLVLSAYARLSQVILDYAIQSGRTAYILHPVPSHSAKSNFQNLFEEFDVTRHEL